MKFRDFLQEKLKDDKYEIKILSRSDIKKANDIAEIVFDGYYDHNPDNPNDESVIWAEYGDLVQKFIDELNKFNIKHKLQKRK